MARITWLMLWMVGSVVAWGADAAAAPELVVVAPAGLSIDFGPVNVGTTSAPSRVRVRNTGTRTIAPAAYLGTAAPFYIVGSGGSLGPGEEMYWDLDAAPAPADVGGPGYDTFIIVYDDVDGNTVELDIQIACQIRRTPFDALDARFRVGPFTTTTTTITVTNTSATARTITGFTSPDAAFTARLHAGTLPLTVASESTFELDVSFAPTSPSAVYLSEIDVTLDDHSSAFGVGTDGVTRGTLSLEDRRGLSWDGVPVGETWLRRGTLVNYGPTPQTITGLVFDHAEFGIAGVAVGTTIPPRASVPVAIRFSPAAIGPQFSSMTMSFTSVADVTGLFDGEGVTALVRITTDDDAPDDGLLEYGDLELGSAPVTRGITITNISGTTLPVNRCEVFVGDGFAPPPPCPSFFPMAAGASIHVDLVFTPSAIGDGAARLTFSASGMNYTIQVLISARVTQHAFALSADALAFADTVRHPAQPATADLTFTNTGTEPLDVPAASIDGAGFVVVVRPPPGTLAPGASVTYTVGFDPAATAAYFGTLVLGPPASPIASVPLHGAGVLRPITADAALDLGPAPIGTTVRASITLHGAGTVAFTIASLTAGDPRFHVIAPAELAVPAGGDRTIDVAYTPTAVGDDDTTLAISFDGDPEPQLVIALHGEGVAATPATEPGGCGCRSGGPAGSGPLLALAFAFVRRRRRRAS